MVQSIGGNVGTERVVNATEARVHFGDLLRRVKEGDTVVVERGGVPQAVVIGLPQYQRLSTGNQAGAWRRLAQTAREQARGELRGKQVPLPEDMLDESREERDEQFPHLR
jgi:prevent-host-death family protein